MAVDRRAVAERATATRAARRAGERGQGGAPGGTDSNTSHQTPILAPRLSIGWIQGTLRAETETLREVLRPFLGAFREVDFGSKLYRRQARTEEGAWIQWHPTMRADARQGEHRVVVPGEVCERLGWLECVSLIVALEARGFRWTRLDVSWDDRERVMLPHQVGEEFDAGRKLGHVQKGNLVRGLGTEAGETLYIGKRKSPLFGRVYDKDAERAARTGEAVQVGVWGIRWELEAKGARAQLLAQEVVLITGELGGDYERGCARAFWSVWRGFCDFRQVEKGEDHPERKPLSEWWVRLIGQADRVVLSVPRKRSGIQKRYARFLGQYARTVALFHVWSTGVVEEGNAPNDQVLSPLLAGLVRVGLEQLTSEDWERVRLELAA